MRCCTKCLLKQPLDNFYPNRFNSEGLSTRCKACIKNAGATYRQKNREKDLHRKKTYRESHKEELREKNREYNRTHKRKKIPSKKHPDRLRVNYIYIFLRDKGICQLCFKTVDPYDAHFDHVIPRSKGGEHSLKNIVLTHAFCNQSKSNRSITQQQRLFP